MSLAFKLRKIQSTRARKKRESQYPIFSEYISSLNFTSFALVIQYRPCARCSCIRRANTKYSLVVKSSPKHVFSRERDATPNQCHHPAQQMNGSIPFLLLNTLTLQTAFSDSEVASTTAEERGRAAGLKMNSGQQGYYLLLLGNIHGH